MDKRFTTIPETAEIVKGAIAIESYNEKYGLLTIAVPNDWADVKRLSRHVLKYAARGCCAQTFVFSGWDSDKHLAYFRTVQSVRAVQSAISKICDIEPVRYSVTTTDENYAMVAR